MLANEDFQNQMGLVQNCGKGWKKSCVIKKRKRAYRRMTVNLGEGLSGPLRLPVVSGFRRAHLLCGGRQHPSLWAQELEQQSPIAKQWSNHKCLPVILCNRTGRSTNQGGLRDLQSSWRQNYKRSKPRDVRNSWQSGKQFSSEGMVPTGS